MAACDRRGLIADAGRLRLGRRLGRRARGLQRPPQLLAARDERRRALVVAAVAFVGGGETPTLLVWGAKDWVFDDHFLRGFQTRLPKAETLRIADAGHYVLEDARDVVLQRIERFFKENPLAEGTA